MNRLAFLVMLGVVGASIILFKASLLFVLLALMPSIMAYIVDYEKGKYTFKVVCSGNVSASLPTLLPMFKSMNNSHKFDMTAVLLDPKVWLFIYMGAGAGWALIYLCKFISRFVVTMKFEYNIKSLENTQEMLIEEWGDKIKAAGVAAEAEADEALMT